MHLRSILSGTLMVLLVSNVAVSASDTDPSNQSDRGFSFKLPGVEIPALFGNKRTNDVQLAQSSTSVGVTGLEEQIRSMNGKIEELNFQILQMQEQIRKTQEDNEFRFQQLEQGSGGSQNGAQKSDAGTDTGSAVAEQGGSTVGDVIVDSGNGEPGKVIPGASSKTFGTITVDKNGNVIDAGGTQSTTPMDQKPAGANASNETGGSIVAALPATDNPDELYRNSYQFILSGDYGTAEEGFRDLISRFPKDTKSADAHYWLGEALLGQQKYRDAAEIFLAASKDYPKAKKAPDMLLKLGVSLTGLHQRDVACATFSEIAKRYPEISGTLKKRVKQEQALAAC